MPSISDSDQSVSVTDLDVCFRLRFNREQSLRARFIELLSSPLSFLRHQPQNLRVLRNISFSARRGDRIAIIGRNGAGKTTLCRFLAGIYRSPAVKVKADLKVRAILDPGVVIYPELTGRENARVLISLFYPELTSLERDSLLSEVLEFSGLAEFLDSTYRHYSSGMQSRLCLSVAAARPADIFVLDEVFEVADKLFKEKISQRILDLIEKSGVVFFVSHSEEQSRRVCNKALVLEAGEIRFFGDLNAGFELYNQLLLTGTPHASGDEMRDLGC